MNRRSEAGFTLVELLVVVATLATLAAISMKNYTAYKERVYIAQEKDVIRQLRTSVEGGKIELGMARDLTDWDTWAWAEQNQAAPAQGFRVKDLLPGYRHDKHMYIYVEHNGICDAGFWGDWCLITNINVRHCQTKRTMNFSSFKSGQEMFWEWDNGGAWPCQT